MLKIVCLAVSLALAVPGLAFAQSAKFSAAVSNVTLIPAQIGDGSWTSVPKLSTSIKTPNKKDLLIGLSLETGLLTQTVVKSKGGTLDTSSATAVLKVRVLVDGQTGVAFPTEVVYDKRIQTLSVNLGGFNCTADADGIVTCDDPEVIDLLLNTMGAHHFNFLVPNLTPGVHSVDVQVSIGTATSSVAGSASATVEVGRGSLTVEEVRATNQPDGITIELQ